MPGHQSLRQPRSVAEAGTQPSELWPQLTDLRAEVQRLRTENVRLRERLRELEARLGQHSGNSAGPPGRPRGAVRSG